MPQWFDNYADNLIGRLGYTKARGNRVDIGTVFSGEAPLYSGRNWDSWSDEDWEKLAITSSWVYSDIDLIAKVSAEAGLEVHEQDGERTVAVPNHDFEQLLRKPNRFMSPSFLKRYTMTWWLLRGEAYWWLVPNKAGGLAEIWPIPSTRMRPIPDKQNYISSYGYSPRHGEPEIPIPTEQVCFFRLPNPFDYHRGMSPLTAYSKALKTDQGAQDWNLGTFLEGSPFRDILSAPENITTPNLAKLRADIQDQFIARKRMLVVGGGDLSVSQLGLSPHDMEFLSGREFTREEIDRVFGVPAGFWAKDATRANSEAARASLIQYGVWPLLTMMSEEVEAQVIDRYYDPGLTVKPKDIRPRDRSLEVEEHRVNWQVMTVNEARSELGLDELEDDEVGETLVPQAVKGQPVAMPQLGGGLAQEASPSPAEEREAKADLRRWERVALRRLRDGRPPGEYEFQSDYLDADVMRQVKAMLDGAKSEEEVRAAFAADPFLEGAGHRWEQYP